MRISDWSSDVCSSDLAALPAFLRRLPWPALQHRELCAAAAHAGAAMRSGAGRVHLDGRRHAYLQQPHGAGAAAADARTAAAATPGAEAPPPRHRLLSI